MIFSLLSKYLFVPTYIFVTDVLVCVCVGVSMCFIHIITMKDIELSETTTHSLCETFDQKRKIYHFVHHNLTRSNLCIPNFL